MNFPRNNKFHYGNIWKSVQCVWNRLLSANLVPFSFCLGRRTSGFRFPFFYLIHSHLRTFIHTHILLCCVRLDREFNYILIVGRTEESWSRKYEVDWFSLIHMYQCYGRRLSIRQRQKWRRRWRQTDRGREVERDYGIASENKSKSRNNSSIHNSFPEINS